MPTHALLRSLLIATFVTFGRAHAQDVAPTPPRLELRRDPCSLMLPPRAQACRESGLERRGLARAELALGHVALAAVAFDALAIAVAGSCWSDACSDPPRGLYAGLGTGAALGFVGASVLLIHGGVRARRVRQGSRTHALLVLPGLALPPTVDPDRRYGASVALHVIGAFE